MYETVLSSKGQIVLPAKIRKDEKWKKGEKFVVKRTPFGVMIINIPKNPIKALRGIAKHMNISDKEIKEMRKKNEQHDIAEKNI
ncbi:MAG: AbrB/MazE/SpoVT family DNA-binding domain-containing protein [Candidatus Diapherotrites archaeon]